MLQNAIAQVFKGSFERITGAIKGIDNYHAYIHEGKFFTHATKFTLTTGAVTKFTIVTPATPFVHYRPMNIITSVDAVSAIFYEGSSGNSGGTSLTMVNRNRNSGIAATSILKSGVTVTSNGTQISQLYMPGSTGNGQSRSGTQLSGNNEWVLKPSTVYTIEFTNGSSASNTIFIEFQWYEEASA
jgi:hypothetical protein